MIRFYLGEEPLLANVPTYVLRRKEDLDYTLAHLHELVVKEVHGAGGYGMLIGPAATQGTARSVSRAHPAIAGKIHRATDARAVGVPDVRRIGRRAAAHRSAAVRAVGPRRHAGARRPDARRAAARLAGREFIARRRHQRHVGARSMRLPGSAHAEPHRRSSLLDGALHRARRKPRAHARGELPDVAAAAGRRDRRARLDRDAHDHRPARSVPAAL